MSNTPVAPDASQSLFTIPQEILDTFSGIVKGFQVIQKTDWLGLGLVGLGLLVVFMAVVAIFFEQAVQKPVQEFAKSDLAGTLARKVI